MAIDFGERRVGLALSDELGMIASGAGTIANNDDTIPHIVGLVSERGVTRVIVGLPLTLRGEHGNAARMVQRFVDVLKKSLEIPVQLVDERFTSTMATQTIRDMGVGKKKRRNKGKIDEIAAVILLQGFLDTP